VVRQVLDHVVAHPDGDLSASTLAAHAGVSVRQLNRLFHENVGEPPGVAVRRIRLEVAARLLATTELPLSQVGRRCGFSSGETLRQAFVARFGVAPRTFRQTQSRSVATA
jgi:transcriptional regulator GlxA family with amidase domain